jgi:hypothetical protein
MSRPILDLSVVRCTQFHGIKYIRPLKLSEVVGNYLASKTKGMLLMNNAIRSLTDRNLPLPPIEIFANKDYIKLNEAALLLPGLITTGLLELLPFIKGLPGLFWLEKRLKEEELIREQRISQFPNIDTVRFAVSKQSPDTVLAEVLPLLLGRDAEYWDNEVLPQVYKEFLNSEFPAQTSGPFFGYSDFIHFCLPSSDGRKSILEYVKFKECFVPCVSRAVLDFILLKADQNATSLAAAPSLANVSNTSAGTSSDALSTSTLSTAKLDISVVPHVVSEGVEYLHSSKFCEAVMKYIGKSKTYSSAAIAKSAIVALTRRNLDLPLLVNIKGNNYVTLDDAVKLLRGLVLDEKNLIDLLPKVEGLPSAQLLLITLKEEELIKEHQRSLFSNTLGLFPETVRTAVSKQSPDTIVAEIYPILIALGYEHQAAIDYWNNTLSQQIIEGESQQVSQRIEIQSNLCTLSSDGRKSIVEYVKFNGASKPTPCVSCSVLEIILPKAAAKTKIGEEILQKAVHTLIRAEVGDITLAAEVLGVIPNTAAQEFVLGADEAARQQTVDRAAGIVAIRGAYKIDFKIPDEIWDEGDLYFARLQYNGTPMKIASSTQINVRSEQHARNGISVQAYVPNGLKLEIPLQRLMKKFKATEKDGAPPHEREWIIWPDTPEKLLEMVGADAISAAMTRQVFSMGGDCNKRQRLNDLDYKVHEAEVATQIAGEEAKAMDIRAKSEAVIAVDKAKAEVAIAMEKAKAEAAIAEEKAKSDAVIAEEKARSGARVALMNTISQGNLDQAEKCIALLKELRGL